MALTAAEQLTWLLGEIDAGRITPQNCAGYGIPTGQFYSVCAQLTADSGGGGGGGAYLPLAGGIMADNATIGFDNSSAIREAGAQGLEIECSVGYRWQWVAGRMILRQVNSGQIQRVLAIDGVTPGATDDFSDGFIVGTRWETQDGTIYECTNSSNGAAVWENKTVQYIIDPEVAYVRTNGSDTTGDGSISKPFLTLNKAIVMEGFRVVDIGVGTFAGFFSTGNIVLFIRGCGETKTIIDSEIRNTDGTLYIKDFGVRSVRINGNCSTFSATYGVGPNLTVEDISAYSIASSGSPGTAGATGYSAGTVTVLGACKITYISAGGGNGGSGAAPNEEESNPGYPGGQGGSGGVVVIEGPTVCDGYIFAGGGAGGDDAGAGSGGSGSDGSVTIKGALNVVAPINANVYITGSIVAGGFVASSP